MGTGEFRHKRRERKLTQNLRGKKTKDTVEDNTEEKILKQATNPKRKLEGGKRISRKQPIEEVSIVSSVNSNFPRALRVQVPE